MRELLIIGSQVRALVRPPSSLRKPHVSGTTLNRAFLRGFPATLFLDFGLCRRSRIFVAIFGALSLHPKIPFPAAGIEPEVRPQLPPAIPTFGPPLLGILGRRCNYSG
jgi:hypothetical protein